MNFDQTDQINDTNRTYSVSELNRKVKSLLEIHFSLVWIEGEISNLSKPASGHWYFSLKDEGAQIRCAMFRGRNTRVNFAPKVGDKVKVRAQVSLYEGRGDFQLIVEHMEEQGFGLLLKQFEALKLNLFKEGLFDESRKKTLPKFPKHIAVITSATGAAIQDVISVFSRRFPSLLISVIPSSVQGDNAADEMINAIELSQKQEGIDLVLLTRGGGSMEDLWAFNNERLARCIAAADLPIVSAVGHEVDFTIADFVADFRAPTPSAAAEIICPDTDELFGYFDNYKEQLNQKIKSKIIEENNRIENIKLKMKHPLDKIHQWMQTIDIKERSLRTQFNFILEKYHTRFSMMNHRLLHATPKNKITKYKINLDMLNEHLIKNIQKLQNFRDQEVRHLVHNLNTLSPLATVARGYSITKNKKGKIVQSVTDIKEEDIIETKISDGTISSRVIEISKDNN